MTVTPRFVKSLSAVRTTSLDVESRPDVGSSRNKQVGSAHSSRPMLTRLRCPPLIPRFSTEPTIELRIRSSWSSFSVSSTIAICFSVEQFCGSRSCALYVRFSSTVRSSWTTMAAQLSQLGVNASVRNMHAPSSWGTNPTDFLCRRMWSARPLILTLPVTVP